MLQFLDTYFVPANDEPAVPGKTDSSPKRNGKIAQGEKINLRSKLAPERIFKLTVKDFQPHKRLSWGDAMGTRIYTLAANTNGGTRFSMSEKIGGPIFPLFARMIPSFDESFNQFAADLKVAAEERI